MIYTFYTETHKVFLDDWFMKTIREKNKVHIEKFEQRCHSGSFMGEGWNKSMLDKIDYIRDCLAKNELFFHLDCDIQFFNHFYEEYINLLEKNNLDFLAQHDGNNTICCGFMLLRPSEKMKMFWDEVYDITKNRLLGERTNDQVACNYLIKQRSIKTGLLGNDCFSIWMANGMKVWEPKDKNFFVPKNIRIHHANYTVGVENKIKLLEMVKNVVG